MPNHVTNLLTFNCSDEEFDKILDFVKSTDDEKQTFDFNRMIPRAKELDIIVDSKSVYGRNLYQSFLAEYAKEKGLEKVDIRSISENDERKYIESLSDDIKEKEGFKKDWELGKKQCINIEKYKFPTWYEWSISNWNTKWNAYDIYIMKDSHTIEFLTAYSAPEPVINKLSKLFPKVDFTHEWADEFFGNTCGRCKYEKGKLTEEYIPDFGKEQAPLYCKIHGLDLNEFLKEYMPKTNAVVEERREKYQKGTRIEINEDIDDREVVRKGTRGSVISVDDTGTIFLQLDNGRIFGLIPEEDDFHILTDEELLSEQIGADDNLSFKDELAKRMVEFMTKYDIYKSHDEYKENDETAAYKEIRKELDSKEEINIIRDYFKNNVIPSITDKELLDSAKEIKNDLDKIDNDFDNEIKNNNKFELEKEKLNNDVLEVAKNFQHNPEDINEFLEFQSRFYNYSIRNQMLIYKQNPNATFCASFNQLRKNGHSVRKGEHGMKILVPVKKTYLQLKEGKTVELSKASSEQKKAFRNGEIKAKTYNFYRVGTVFDISQTNIKSEELPKIIDPGYKSEQHAELFKILKSYCENELNCPVKENAYSSVSVRGEYDASKHEIRISSNFDDTTKLSILSHEMGHCMMHGIKSDALKERARCQIEFEADALSIMLSKKMGVEIPNSRQNHVRDCLQDLTKLKDYTPEMITESLKRASDAYSDVTKVIGNSITQNQEISNSVKTNTNNQSMSLPNQFNTYSIGSMGGLSPA